MTDEQIIQYAVEEGFAAAAIVDTCDIVFDPSFRPYYAVTIKTLRTGAGAPQGSLV